LNAIKGVTGKGIEEIREGKRAIRQMAMELILSGRRVKGARNWRVTGDHTYIGKSRAEEIEGRQK